MKKFRNAIIAVLVFTMVLCMAGCGGAKPSELAGSWGTEVSVQNSLMRSLGSAAEGYTEPLTLTVYLTMDADGNYTVGPDGEESGPAIMAWAEGCADFMVQRLIDEFKALGKDQATAEKMLEKEYGMPAKEFMMADMQERLNLTTLLANYVEEGTYSVKGGKISFAKAGTEINTEVYENIKVKDNTLTLTVPEGGSAQILRNVARPLEMIKK